MEPLRHRSGSISRTEPFHFEHRRGLLRWAKRNVNANLPAACVISMVLVVIILVLWMLTVMFSNRSGAIAEAPASRIVQFAMDELRRMSQGDVRSLQLISVISHTTKYEKLPGLDEPIDTVDNLILRIRSSRDSDVVFDHHIVISTDSSGLSAVTAYSCSYESSDRRYPGVELPGHAVSSSEIQVRPKPIRVLSVNTWNYNHWVKRLPLLKETFDVYLPDIVTFQEVRARKVSSEGRNRFMVEDIRQLLPHMQFVFEPAMRFRDGDEIVHEGVAVFSKFPIADYSSTKLSQIPNDSADFHQRIALRTAIVWGYGLDTNRALHIVTTHLSLSATARQKSFPELHEIVQRASAGGIYPVILTGDFNAEGISAENHLPLMQDAWTVTHPGTQHSQEGFTFNSWFPKSRIDYIFSKGLKAIHCSVIGGGSGVPVAEGLPPGFGVQNTRDVLYASDHMFPFAILSKE